MGCAGGGVLPHRLGRAGPKGPACRDRRVLLEGEGPGVPRATQGGFGSLEGKAMRRQLWGAPVGWLLLVSGGQAATLHVPAGYSTIQAGIDAATAGDSVLVAPGT